MQETISQEQFVIIPLSIRSLSSILTYEAFEQELRLGHNPFINQVSFFYISHPEANTQRRCVIIPLSIRSLSSACYSSLI